MFEDKTLTETRRRLKAAYQEKNGLTEKLRGPKNGVVFLKRKRLTPGHWPELPRCADHVSYWLKDGRPYSIVLQPYGHLSWSQIVDLAYFCESHELVASVGAHQSWHYPGSTLLVEIRGVQPGDLQLHGQVGVSHLDLSVSKKHVSGFHHAGSIPAEREAS